ncbi:MAG: ABC transporter ATP-binding protein/permease [Clostridiales bacterium]|jgi:ATP-binding cassette subfamily B protein|nr:ABC transporter ATP-binding protein/permease [Clostridiales bacterium]
MLKVFTYLKPYIHIVILTVVLLFAQSVSELMLPAYMSNVVDVGITRGGIENAQITSATGAEPGQLQMNYLIKSGGIMLAISFLIMICGISGSYLSSLVSSRVGRDLRSDLFSKVTRFSNKNFDKFSASTLITRCTNDVQQVQMSVMMMLRMVLMAPLTGIGGIIMVLRSDSGLSRIIIISVAAIFSVVTILFSKASPKFKISQKLLDKVNLVVRESLSGMLVIRAFGRQEYEEGKFAKANRDLTDVHLFIGRLMGVMFPATSIIMNFTTVAILWFGAGAVSSYASETGEIMAVIQYAMQIMFSFMMISMISIMLPRALVSAARIKEVLEETEDITDPAAEKPIKGSKGTVEFQNVYFKYPGADEYVLEDISFTASPGKTTAIIGSTGSGKSTVINLIPRFYDVTDGKILIGGTDIREMTQKNLRGLIGYVPQKGILFSGTIESNIKYAGFDIPDDEMEKAAKIAQADFIYEKEDKFGEHIAQGGTNVSGGQRQRVSIARALAKQPGIFIFDDSFSALDYKTDAKLRRALKDEVKDATVIIVAQRISTIMNAEQIIVLDDGKIAGCGTHAELLKTCDVYMQIASSQLSANELNGKYSPKAALEGLA